ncbi:MAG: MOP flippase family protein [Clostridium sp.]|uniref:MOP flippase family protein n=1 Tax=Clostridium sp. TaxID=1506 RepID=UPI003F3820E4
MNKENDLKKKTVGGLIWTFSDLIVNQGLQFVIQIVLARLLLPEEFGLIGMITIFIALANTIVDSGFSNALIREKKVTQAEYSTVFYFNLLMAIILYVVLFLLSPKISLFFRQPQLSEILRVLAITFVINSFGLIQRTMLTRELSFKPQMLINMIASICSGVGAIVLAYLGFGVWSLVFRTLILQGMQAILLCLINRWRPSITFDFKSFKKFFNFSWKLLISGVIDTIYNNLYYVIIGKIYSPTELGYYTNAQKLRDTAVQSISNSIQKVTYPMLSKIKEEEEKLKESYKSLMKHASYINFPIMIGLAVVGRKLIIVLFGPEWIPSIDMFIILCISGMLYPMQALNLNILQVKGRSDLFLKLEIAKKIINVILIAIAIYMRAGIISLIWVIFINSIISFFINSHYSKEIIGYSTFEQIKDMAPILLITGLAAGITLIIGKILCTPNFEFLVIELVVGFSLYILFSYIFKIESFFFILEIIKKIIKR